MAVDCGALHSTAGTNSSAAAALEAATGHAESSIDRIIPLLVISIICGVLVKLLKARFSKWMPFPFSVLLFVLGLLLSLILGPDPALINTGIVARSVCEWRAIHPHVILFVMLPPLLFESAFAMEFNIFSRVSGQSFMMAVPGMFVSVALTGTYIFYLFTNQEASGFVWDWSHSFLLASILSATDPVAVVAVLQKLGAPKHYAALVEGESLLNDGSAFVMFEIFRIWVRGESLTAGGVIWKGFTLSILGPLWGLLCAYVVYLFLHLIYNDPITEVTLMLCAIFGMFVMAELTLHVSGVLAVVVFGLFMSKSGKYAMSPEVHHTLHVVLEEVAFFANTLIFIGAGVVVMGQIIKNSDIYTNGWNYLNLFISYALLHVIRLLLIFMFFPLIRKWGYGLSVKGGVFMAFGGLRGAVGLALALIVDQDNGIQNAAGAKYQQLINFHVMGIVALTLLVNGSLAGWVYEKLQIFVVHHTFKNDLRYKAMELLDTHQDRLLSEHCEDRFFSDTRKGLAEQLLPKYTQIFPKPIKGSDEEQEVKPYKMKSVGYYFRKERAKGLWNAAVRKSRQTPHGLKVGFVKALQKDSVAAGPVATHSGSSIGVGAGAGAGAGEMQRNHSSASQSSQHTHRLAQPTNGSSEESVHAFTGNDADVTAAFKTPAKSIYDLRLKEVEEMFEVFFLSLAASYENMFESRFVDGPAMLILTDSVDAGRQANKALKGGLLAQADKDPPPFTAAWLSLSKRLNATLRRSGCGIIQDWIMYSRVKIALEVLRAFVTAHENLTGREHFTLNNNIEQDRQNVITLATEETSRIKVNFPRLYKVITTVSLCKVVLVSMPKMVKHLHHHDALIDEKTSNAVRAIIDERMFDYDSFFPSTFTLGSRAPQKEARGSVVRVASVEQTTHTYDDNSNNNHSGSNSSRNRNGGMAPLEMA